MRRVVLTAAVAGGVKTDRPRKRLVETAHPRLREAWAATGVLTAADFAAARGDDVPYSVRRSLLGDVDDIPASDCGDDRKRAGAEWCFNGTDPGDMDDDWARTDLMGLNPGACATCGFVDGPLNNNGLPAGLTDPWTPATWPFDWPYDCVTCEDPADELVVFFRDCTGACVDAAGVEELRALGFGTLDESGCYAKRGCYPVGFLDAYSVEGVNNHFFEDRVAVEQTCVPTCPDGSTGIASGDDYFCDGAYVCSNDGTKAPRCCDVGTLCWGNVQAYCVSPLDERLGYLPDSRDCWAACVQRDAADMRPEPGTNPEWDARVLSWQQKRDDITQRFRWRRHHNQRQATRYGQANGWHSSGRPPREEAPRPLPHAVGAIKDWRYYRRAASGLQTGGAIWTDLYNAPLRNVKKLGLVNKKVLQEDINGLEHICAIVAREQDAQQAEHDRIKAQAEEIRADFVQTLRENRDKPGGVDYTRRIMGKEVLPPTLLGPPRVTARTERLSHGHKGVAARRELFERLGCQDMKGLLVTDRGLAEHMHTLAALVDVELPKNKFIPKKDSSFQGPRVKT